MTAAALAQAPRQSAGTGVESGAGTAQSGAAMTGGDNQPPALDMHDSRLSALVDACCPASARRPGNEGRARVYLAVDAAGRAASWSLEAGTGFSRLDSAVDCVVGRPELQPARRKGRAVAADVRQTIVFRLN
jgi:TonB family protein